MGVQHPQFGTYCEICFDALHQDTCAIDQNGTRWDVCPGICARQAGITEKTTFIPPVVATEVRYDPLGQYGHNGQHHGNGTPGCPTQLHHHHDDRCTPPT